MIRTGAARNHNRAGDTRSIRRRREHRLDPVARSIRGRIRPVVSLRRARRVRIRREVSILPVRIRRVVRRRFSHRRVVTPVTATRVIHW